MSQFNKIVEAIKSGKRVTACGNDVFAENIDYVWQTPELRVQLLSGASYPLEGRELMTALICNIETIED